MARIRREQIGSQVGLIQPKQIEGFAGSPLLPFYEGQFNRDNGQNTSCLTAANRVAIVGGDIMRRQDRGIGAGNNLFIEPGRAQYCLQTQFFPAPWTLLNGATLTPQSTLGPNNWAVHLASLVTYPASAVAQLEETYSTSFIPASTIMTLSVWAKLSSGNGSFKFQFTDNAGAAQTSAVFTPGTFWQRFSFTVNSGVGIGPCVFRLVNGDATAKGVFFWGPQLEASTEVSSNIFNDTSSLAMTAPDVLQFSPGQVPYQFLALRHSSIFYCERSMANVVANNDRLIIDSINNDQNTLEVSVVAGSAYLRAFVNGVEQARSQALTQGVYGAAPYIVDPPAGLLYVNGVAGPAGTPWTWPNGTVRKGGAVGLIGSEFRGELGQDYVA